MKTGSPPKLSCSSKHTATSHMNAKTTQYIKYSCHCFTKQKYFEAMVKTSSSPEGFASFGSEWHINRPLSEKA